MLKGFNNRICRGVDIKLRDRHMAQQPSLQQWEYRNRLLLLNVYEMSQ